MPFCPACHLERLQAVATCPLDGQLYRIRRCPGCSAEIAPDERWCIHCGRPVVDAEARVEVVHLERASLARRALALLVDALCLSYVAMAFPAVLDSLLEVLGPYRVGAVTSILVFLPWVYLAVWKAEGRRTIGDQVLGVSVLRSDRTPLDLGRSVLRATLLPLAPLGLLTRKRRWLHDLAADSEAFAVLR